MARRSWRLPRNWASRERPNEPQAETTGADRWRRGLSDGRGAAGDVRIQPVGRLFLRAVRPRQGYDPARDANPPWRPREGRILEAWPGNARDFRCNGHAEHSF